MSASRQLIDKLLVISPLVLIAGIAVHARTSTDPYEIPQYSADLQARVTAFRQPVRWVVELERRRDEITLGEVVEVADRWIEWHEQGRIGPLPSIRPGDTMREGAKLEIFQASERLMSELTRRAHAAEENETPALAAELLGKALRVTNVTKYSDLYSAGTIAMRQRAVLKQLEDLAPKLSEVEREGMANQLEKALSGEQSIVPLVARARRQFYTESRRQGIDRVPIEEVGVLVELPGDSASPSRLRTIGRSLQARLMAGMGAPGYLTETQYACTAMGNLYEAYEATLHALGRSITVE